MSDLLGTRIKQVMEKQVDNYDHHTHIQRMLKIIMVADMDLDTKMVMRANIWGLEPGTFAPLSPYQIQLVDRGMKSCSKCRVSGLVDEKGYNQIQKCSECFRGEARIKGMIEKGKKVLEETVSKVETQVLIDKFNADAREYRRLMFAPKNAKNHGLKL